MVFGAAIGSRIDQVEGISYGAFIVPGLIMLTVMTQAISQRLLWHLFPEIHRHDFELLSAPVNFLEIVLGYVGAAATKALFIGVVILCHLVLLCGHHIQHPFCDGAVSGADLLSAFALFGFIIGIWAGNFRTAATGAAVDDHALGVSLGVVLFDLDVAARLADDLDCSIRWFT